MRAARIAVTVVATAMAALAMAPATSLGQGPVEVVFETSGVHCHDVVLTGHAVSGGCALRIGTESLKLIRHPVGTEQEVTLADCTLELWLHVDEAGSGLMTDQVLDQGDAGCGTTYQACREPGTATKLPWGIFIVEDGGTEFAPITFCLEISIGGGGACFLIADVVATVTHLGSHAYDISIPDRLLVNKTIIPSPNNMTVSEACNALLGVDLELDGQFEIDSFSSDKIEIIHL
jgi:hypothetical protein